jgi:hypothetical protein
MCSRQPNYMPDTIGWCSHSRNSKNQPDLHLSFRKVSCPNPRNMRVRRTSHELQQGPPPVTQVPPVDGPPPVTRVPPVAVNPLVFVLPPVLTVPPMLMLPPVALIPPILGLPLAGFTPPVEGAPPVDGCPPTLATNRSPRPERPPQSAANRIGIIKSKFSWRMAACARCYLGSTCTRRRELTQPL